MHRWPIWDQNEIDCPALMNSREEMDVRLRQIDRARIDRPIGRSIDCTEDDNAEQRRFDVDRVRQINLDELDGTCLLATGGRTD